MHRSTPTCRWWLTSARPCCEGGFRPPCIPLATRRRSCLSSTAADFARRIEEELARAKRFDRDLALVVVESEVLAWPQETTDRLVDLLRGELRGSDVLGLVGERRVVVLLIETHESAVSTVVRRLRERLGRAIPELKFPTLVLGQAAFSTTCATADAMLSQAAVNAETIGCRHDAGFSVGGFGRPTLRRDMRRGMGDRRQRPRFDVVGQVAGTLDAAVSMGLRDVGRGGAQVESFVRLADRFAASRDVQRRRHRGRRSSLRATRQTGRLEHWRAAISDRDGVREPVAGGGGADRTMVDAPRRRSLSVRRTELSDDRGRGKPANLRIADARRG